MASKAYTDGAEFGAALAAAMAVDLSKADSGAVFMVGKRFALMSQYRELNAGLDWVAGFSDGFLSKPKAQKAIAAAQDAESDQ